MLPDYHPKTHSLVSASQPSLQRFARFNHQFLNEAWGATQLATNFSYDPHSGWGRCFGKHGRFSPAELCRLLGVQMAPVRNIA